MVSQLPYDVSRADSIVLDMIKMPGVPLRNINPTVEILATLASCDDCVKQFKDVCISSVESTN